MSEFIISISGGTSAFDKHVYCTKRMFPRFVTLQPGRENDASGQISVRCDATGVSLKWNDACRNGWVIDNRPANGRHHEYLSPEGRVLREGDK